MATHWCDPEMALRFLTGLHIRPTTPLTFQLVPHGTGRPHILHGSFPTLLPSLWEANRTGVSIFLTINTTDGKGRKTENITGLRALFVDIDDPGVHAVVDATMTVWSGHGWHAYWTLQEGEPLDAFTAAQKHLIRFYGSDKAVCDLPRAMRVPGFLNPKEPVAPVRLTMQTDTRWTIADVLARHPLPPVAPFTAPPILPDTDAETRRYRAWAQTKDTTEGQRNHTAYVIAADGFRRGLDPTVIHATVVTYCVRAGIPDEAETVFRSAQRKAPTA